MMAQFITQSQVLFVSSIKANLYLRVSSIWFVMYCIALVDFRKFIFAEIFPEIYGNFGNLFFIKILGKFSNSNEEISPCLKERLHSDQIL